MQIEKATLAAAAMDRPAIRSARVAWIFCASIAAIAVLPFLFSVRFLGEPLGRDQAVYFTVVR